jgi:hypothetical protein
MSASFSHGAKKSVTPTAIIAAKFARPSEG